MRLRLQKAIAQTGMTSRRAAENLIRKGRVSVNGMPAHLGDRIDPAIDHVEVDGVPLPVRPTLEYFLINKPAGHVSTSSDPQGRPTVTGLGPPEARVWPVGRLDVDSEGLLILTNDGTLTFLLTHPRHGVTKTYRVLLEGVVSEAHLRVLLDGVQLEDGLARAVDARVLDRAAHRTSVEVVMGEGRKREVRRMFHALGFPVVRLFRSAIDGLEDPRLRPGQHRPLSVHEVRALYEAAGWQSDTVPMVQGTWVVAVDGPAGAGKTTVSRAVARLLGLEHLDTGAYYRAATLLALRRGLAASDGELVAALGDEQLDYRNGRTTLSAEDVTEAIRGSEVTSRVSDIAAVPEVRSVMVNRQREWVAVRGGSAIVEGRDIGTVVFPGARLKVFLTGSPEIRAERRAAQHPELPDVHLELERRDDLDSRRDASPLTPAEDAVVIDTSQMAFEEVVAAVVHLARQRGF